MSHLWKKSPTKIPSSQIQDYLLKKLQSADLYLARVKTVVMHPGQKKRLSLTDHRRVIPMMIFLLTILITPSPLVIIFEIREKKKKQKKNKKTKKPTTFFKA